MEEYSSLMSNESAASGNGGKIVKTADDVHVIILDQNGEVATPQTTTVELHSQLHGDIDCRSPISSSEFEAVNNVSCRGICVEDEKAEWEYRYQEAAMYLKEGEENEQFGSLPRAKNATIAQIIIHNFWFNVIDLLASCFILSLALVESPATIPIPVRIHASFELFALTIIAFDLCMKLRWLGWKEFFSYKRTGLKAVCLSIMYTEAIVVMIYGDAHFRVTRALRPIFLINCHFLGGARRVLQQIIRSIPPIADMMLLLFYFLLIFSVLGFYFFVRVPEDIYFSTIMDSIINLFVLTTTSNFPDVMMPTYHSSSWSVLFFVIFLAIELYFVTNLLLAVVYDTFTGIEKDKFKKLLLHKRLGAEKAFQLLCGDGHLNRICFTHFQGLLRYYAPKLKKHCAFLVFKTLDKSESGMLSLDEFNDVYGITKLKWQSKRDLRPWFETLRCGLAEPCRYIHKLVNSNKFNAFIFIVIVCNSIRYLVRTFKISLYVSECVLKLIGHGVKGYFSSGWNVFDFIANISAICGVLSNVFDTYFYYVVMLWPLRLLRLFKVKKRYRDVLATAYVLLPCMWSVCIVLFILFYFYAIIGMELFHDLPLENCCQSTYFADYYSNTTTFKQYFWLNNFNNIIFSYTTLFELTVVNNWHIIMNGIAEVNGGWSRLYFVVFYLSSMVVMTIVVAFILEAFIFRMRYEKKKHKKQPASADAEVEFQYVLTKAEIKYHFPDARNDEELSELMEEIRTWGKVTFNGTRERTKGDLERTMFADEIKEWIQENEFENNLKSVTSSTENDSQV
ncbi:two pore calcium channel protein 1-like [Anneissia japonica]|uniref:two pore calcium channel protein 1-like n=1 Tax=Anneissia japonica TaxID=1529436 RepID=UPI00142561AB|nr:two pore calcium channel protein 1-like [Anneissia japonica]